MISREPSWRAAAAAMLCLPLASCASYWHSEPSGPWQLEKLVEGSVFHGVHGLAFDADDQLFAASILGQQIYHVNRGLAAARPFVDAPFGQSDGLEFGPDGHLVWSAFIDGDIRTRAPDEKTGTLAKGLSGAAAVGFRDCNVKTPRLYAATALEGGALFEVSIPKGGATELGTIAGLTGFDFGCDGKLYGALVTSGQVVRIDVDQKPLAPEPIATGFRSPADVKFDPKGELYAIDAATGEIFHVDLETKTKTVVAQAPTSLDKMAFDSKGRLYVSVPADNAIVEVNVETGEVQTILNGPLAAPSDVAVVRDGRREWLYVADTFSLKRVDLASGEVESVVRLWENDWTLGSHISVLADTIAIGSWATQSTQIFDRDSGGRIAFIENMGFVQDVLLLEDGSVLYAQFVPGEIVRMNRKGGAREVIASGLTGPMGLAQGPGNTVYVTETGIAPGPADAPRAATGRLLRIDLDTNEVTELASGLAQPEGLAVMKDGRIAVAAVGKRRIVAIDPDSGDIEILKEDLPIGLAFTNTQVPFVVIPTGLAVDSRGSLYFTSDLENAIYRLSRGKAKRPTTPDS